jgi:hypothetical protein
MLSFAAEVGFGKFVEARGVESPLRTIEETSSAGTTLLGLTDKECLPLTGSASFAQSLVPRSQDFVASVLKNRQTAAQSSTFDVGKRVLHIR